VSGTKYQLVKVRYDATSTSATSADSRLATASEIDFYPNPVVDDIRVKVSERAIVKIFDASGAKRMATEVTSENNVINASDLERGRYIIEISNGDKVKRAHFVRD
jgi:hypothetical protein